MSDPEDYVVCIVSGCDDDTLFVFLFSTVLIIIYAGHARDGLRNLPRPETVL